MTTKIVIELEIEGDPQDAYHVVDSLLDNGEPQDSINGHEFDAGDLTVVSAVCRATGQEFPSATIARLVEILWPASNPDAEWENDTIEDVARALEAYRPATDDAATVDNHCDECGESESECICAEADENPDGRADLADGTHEFVAITEASGPVRNAALEALQANGDAVAVKVEGGKVVALVGPNGSTVAC